MNRVLITGATGFCGRHLTDYLVSRGSKVIGTYHPNIHKNPAPRSQNPFYERLNITEHDQTAALIKRYKPAYIYHLAAQSIAYTSSKIQGETFTVNVGGTVNLLNAVRQCAPKARFVFISSSQVYGRTFARHPKVREQDKPDPLNTYAFSKYLGELACLDFRRRFSIDIVLARPFNHLGSGQAPTFVFSEWCRQIALIENKLAQPIIHVGNLKVCRDFLHVNDVVRAYERIALRGKAGSLYNVATGHAIALSAYLHYLLRLSSCSIKVKVENKLKRPNELIQTAGNPKALESLGWRAQESAFDALRDLLNDWRGRIKSEMRKS